MTHTWKIFLMVLRIVAGSVLVLVGLLGLAMPILPGWLFIIPGVLLLAKDVHPIRRLVCWVLGSRLVLWLETRFPNLRAPLQHLRDSIEAHARRRHDREVHCAAKRPQEQRDVA